MPRRRTIALVALGLLLAAAPFLPDSRSPRGTISPSGDAAAPHRPESALGTLTPAMRTEIDRVVDAGLALPSYRGRPAPGVAIASQVRCATFEGLRYCLHLGWTDRSQTQVQAHTTAAARAATGAETTGDLEVMSELQSAAVTDPRYRATAERAELTRAARSVAKVWSIRHEIEGVPYPAGFGQRHPELAAITGAATAPATPADAVRSAAASPARTPAKSASATASASAGGAATPKTAADYPGRGKVLDADQTAAQTRSYWCGPTSMQMIAWGWKGERRSQATWARRLGTTTSGSDIGAIVRAVNDYTGWDRKAYAGPYITLDIGKYGYDKWYLLVMRHIHDYQAPILLHPILLKKYFPYLDDDASGHFQVGRGYAKRGAEPDQIGYFEPWNQQRFDPSEPFIDRVQWRNAYRSFRANQEHPFHNIGV